MTTQTSSPPASVIDRHASQSWPPENDELLMRARQQGLNWQPIATNYFPDKTANACRKRHERLMDKRNNADDWEGVKMEALAKAYVEVREQMWKLLGDRVGEKWETVEAKCMEKGLKTLKTAGRHASRRERATFGGSDFGDEISDSHVSHISRERSKGHGEDDESFNDSAIAIAPDTDHSFTTGAAGLSSSRPSYGSRQSFSSASSTGFTPTITASPQFAPVQQQTLPSFSSAFGMPSISSVIHHHSPPVTTH
ncbi:hypothetical protein MMC28_006318 [Mycoblastus sanguinarius]|nr:hypothetical protein [Mycoblastus sanguinarius]